MKILVVSGSRADWGLLRWPIKLMEADPFFEVEVMTATRGTDTAQAIVLCSAALAANKPDAVMLLGDRIETLGGQLEIEPGEDGFKLTARFDLDETRRLDSTDASHDQHSRR